MPSRRHLLRTLPAVATALAGCADSSPGTNTATGTPTESPTESPTDTPTGSPEGPDGPTRVESDHPAVAWRVDFPFPIEGLDHDAGTLAVTATIGGHGTPTPAEDDRVRGGVGTLAAADGTPQWYTRTRARVYGSPALRDAVYAVTGFGTGLHGVNQRLARVAGGVEWRSERVDDYLSILAVDGTRVYLATSDDALETSGQRLFAVARATGKTVWSREGGDAFDGRRVGDALLVSVAHQAIAAHDPATGTERWSIAVEPIAGPDGTPAVVGDLTFGQAGAKTEDGYPLVGVGLDGTERWRYTHPSASGKNFVPTGVAPAPDGVVGVSFGGLVFGLTPTGDERWTHTLDGSTYGAPVAADGAVFVGDRTGAVTALDAASGAERWRRGFEGSVISLTAAGDLLAVVRRPPKSTGDAGPDRVVHGLAVADGTERWRFETDEEFGALVGDGDGVVVGSDAGAVRKLGG